MIYVIYNQLLKLVGGNTSCEGAKKKITAKWRIMFPTAEASPTDQAIWNTFTHSNMRICLLTLFYNKCSMTFSLPTPLRKPQWHSMISLV